MDPGSGITVTSTKPKTKARSTECSALSAFFIALKTTDIALPSDLPQPPSP
jgi:hypothetical protein